MLVDVMSGLAGHVSARPGSGPGHRALRSRALSDCRARQRAVMRYRASPRQEPFHREMALLKARADHVSRRSTRAFVKPAEPGNRPFKGSKITEPLGSAR